MQDPNLPPDPELIPAPALTPPGMTQRLEVIPADRVVMMATEVQQDGNAGRIPALGIQFYFGDLAVSPIVALTGPGGSKLDGERLAALVLEAVTKTNELHEERAEERAEETTARGSCEVCGQAIFGALVEHGRCLTCEPLAGDTAAPRPRRHRIVLGLRVGRAGKTVCTASRFRRLCTSAAGAIFLGGTILEARPGSGADLGEDAHATGSRSQPGDVVTVAVLEVENADPSLLHGVDGAPVEWLDLPVVRWSSEVIA